MSKGGSVAARVAAIDIGSNAIRFLVVEQRGGPDPKKPFVVLAEDRASTRLGAMLATTGALDPKAVGPAARAIAGFVARARELGCVKVRAVATAAVREATNGRAFVEAVRRRAKIDVDVITTYEEGRLAFESLRRRFEVAESPSACVDIGGGSAQVSVAAHGVLVGVVSLPLGAVRMTQEFGGARKIAGSKFGAFKAYVDGQLKAVLPEMVVRPVVLVGTGGAVNAVAAMLDQRALTAKPGELLSVVNGSRSVALSEAKKLVRQFKKASPGLPERATGLPADRADIAFAGLYVLERVLRQVARGPRLQARGRRDAHEPVLRCHSGGLREGICESLLSELARGPLTPMEEVREFAVRCRYEMPHCELVSRLAVSLFDQLESTGPLRACVKAEPASRLILEAAAVLHDVGILVDYRRHHKHSRSMIRCAGLRCFTPEQLELVAQIARYHRRAVPSLAHEDFAALSKPRRQVVRTLAGILRLADGLDRGHAQMVKSVGVTLEHKLALVTVKSPRLAVTELRAAKAKSDLFVDVWGMKVKLVWAKAVVEG